MPLAAEFLVVSLWRSSDAMLGFARNDIGRGVFYASDDCYSWLGKSA